MPPVDQQMLDEEGRRQHAHPIVHPPERPQLPHAGVDNRVTGLPGLPERPGCLVLGPRESAKLGPEGLVHGLWVVKQEVVGELSPHQLAQIRLRVCDCPIRRCAHRVILNVMPDLPGTDGADRQVRRQARGCSLVGAVSAGVISTQFAYEVLEHVVRRILTGEDIYLKEDFIKLIDMGAVDLVIGAATFLTHLAQTSPLKDLFFASTRVRDMSEEERFLALMHERPDTFVQEVEEAEKAKVEVPSDVPQTHTVKDGDTLWDITQTYYGDPYRWPQVWSYNPDITNPRLYTETYTGENKELVDELIVLSKRHGILTPYTAYLAEEQTDLNDLSRGRRLAQSGLSRLRAEAGESAFRQRAFKGELKSRDRAATPSAASDARDSDRRSRACAGAARPTASPSRCPASRFRDLGMPPAPPSDPDGGWSPGRSPWRGPSGRTT